MTAPQEVVKVLRKIAQEGFVRERELDEKELQIIKQLVQYGVIEVGYTISPDYVDEIAKICKVPVISIPYRRTSRKVLRYLVPLALAAFPAYIGTVGLMMGYPMVALLFYAVAGALVYIGNLLSLKLIRRC